MTEGIDKPLLAGLVTYELSHTLSKYGAVNRGVCILNKNQQLEKIEEHTEIQLKQDGSINGKNSSNNLTKLSPKTRVSMNFWAFSPGIFSLIENYFSNFLIKQLQNSNSECYLPNAIDEFIRSGRLICKTINTNSHWLGITYPQDKSMRKRPLMK